MSSPIPHLEHDKSAYICAAGRRPQLRMTRPINVLFTSTPSLSFSDNSDHSVCTLSCMQRLPLFIYHIQGYKLTSSYSTKPALQMFSCSLLFMYIKFQHLFYYLVFMYVYKPTLHSLVLYFTISFHRHTLSQEARCICFKFLYAFWTSFVLTTI